MSTEPDNELNLDSLFQPDWAQSAPSKNQYANFKGEDPSRSRNRDFQDRPPRRDRPSAPRSKPEGRPSHGGPRPDRRQQDRPQSGGSGERRNFRDQREPARELPALELKVEFLPDERGLESLSKQIRLHGRAYPLFQISQLILDRAERHSVIVSTIKLPGGKAAQPLFLCQPDLSLWLTEESANAHALKINFTKFYAAEKTQIDPPKGNFTFVAQCGLSGALIGPPNHHGYQTSLVKIHSERFSQMPFEAYKARIRIVRDEAVVKQWIDETSSRIEYNCLEIEPAERLKTRAETEAHFRQHHLSKLVASVDRHVYTGPASRALREPAALAQLIRFNYEQNWRFPIQLSTHLSRSFTNHGLHFFKVNKTVVHVSVARPHYLDLSETPVSESVRRLVEFIEAHPQCTRRQILEALAVAPSAAPVAVAAPEAPAVTEAAVAAPQHPTPAQTLVMTDLHWLIHQGHVIEFASGHIETAKKPRPKPEPAAPAAKTSTPEAAASAPIVVQTEVPAEPQPQNP